MDDATTLQRFDTGAALRAACRAGTWDRPTSGLAQGFQQGNIVILPRALADDFLRYCTRNPKPAPILGVSEPAETVTDLGALWQDDFVTFVLGCSFSFETALLRAAIPVRHIDAGRNVPMYTTTIATQPAGSFGGPMVVSMRPFTPADAIRAIVLSSYLPQAHGAPVHLGDPSAIGIKDIATPDFGDAPDIREGDVPVFWACGVTPQSAIRHARPEIAITHEPGHMLVTDLRADIG